MVIRKSHLYAYLIILFPIFNLLGGFFGYYDELIGLIAIIYIWFCVIKGKLDKTSALITVLLAVITAIGIFSNIMSHLILNPFPIVIDILWLWKTFACFIFFSRICSDRYICTQIINVLKTFSKLVIILLFISSIIGQVIDIGVTGESAVFGFKVYGFFWKNGIQTGWLAFCSLILLSLSKCDNKSFYKYFILTCIPLILTGSSLVYCWIIVSFMLFIGMKEQKSFKIRYIILIGAVVALFIWSDLQVYFLSGNSSVRKTLIEYGIKVANMYFPFGSGFATYGSDMAQRYYSSLYQSFGWTNSWALGVNSSFLNDNFFASILGQFGWISFVLYLCALYSVFRTLNTNKISKRTRVTVLSTVIVIFAVMIGSASAKSMMGVCTFSVLGIAYGVIQCNDGCIEE